MAYSAYGKSASGRHFEIDNTYHCSQQSYRCANLSTQNYDNATQLREAAKPNDSHKTHAFRPRLLIPNIQLINTKNIDTEVMNNTLCKSKSSNEFEETKLRPLLIRIIHSHCRCALGICASHLVIIHLLIRCVCGIWLFGRLLCL